MTKRMGAMLAFQEDRRLRQSVLNHVIEARPCPERLKWSADAQEYLARLRLWSAIAQVCQDGFANRSKQRQKRLTPCFRMPNTQSLLAPINVVQAQGRHLAGSQPIGCEQKKNRLVT